MPTSLYNFQYVPLTGRLPGKSFVSQTEQAINGLAQYVYENSTNYEAVKAIAQKAEEDSSSALEYSEEALDKAQTALETVGRAYIKTTSAVDLDDYYDSELLLILSTESTNLPASISGYLTVMSSDTHDYCMQVYIGIDGSVYKRTATISNDVPTFGVWSETPITLSSLQTILANYTTVDASNIGVNADTDNSIVWGNAIGGGEIVSGEQRLVTGDTVYESEYQLEQKVETDIGINDKRITNIEKLLQGNLYDYQTDSTSAYTKTVPGGALSYASLNKVGGKTIVWNQLVDSGTTSVPTITGHKYCRFINYWQRITSSGSPISISDSDTNMVCDLTLMFGAGNEPDEARFGSLFPAEHYSYNAGTLLNAGVTQVISAVADGSNLLPTYSVNRSDSGLTLAVNSDGSVTINGTATYSVEFTAGYNSWQWDGSTRCWLSGCPTGGGDNTYYLDVGYYSEGTGEGWYSQRDYGNGVVLQSRDGGIANKTLGFRIVVKSGVVCNNLTFKPMLQYTNTISTYSIPASIQALEGYGWGIDNVYNEVDIENKKYIKRINKYDFTGSEVLSYYGSGFHETAETFTIIFYDTALFGKASNRKCISNNFIGYVGFNWETPFSVFFNPSYNDSSFLYLIFPFSIKSGLSTSSTNAEKIAAAKEWLQAHPTTLYYQAETSTETDISEYLTDDNLIQVESSGTLTFENQNGTDYQIPVPSEETYMIDLQEALS